MGLGFAPSSGFRLLSHGNFLILLLASYLFSALSWSYAFNYVCNGSFGFWFPDIWILYICLQRWVKDISPLSQELKDDEALESLVLLLKCLKIMENATFLSTDNQVRAKHVSSYWLPPNFSSVELWCLLIIVACFSLQNHLLKMDAKFNSESSAMSFVGLILSAIKILSGYWTLQIFGVSILLWDIMWHHESY